jgi:prepilin-type processing-associated H-X9-DG protein
MEGAMTSTNAKPELDVTLNFKSLRNSKMYIVDTIRYSNNSMGMSYPQHYEWNNREGTDSAGAHARHGGRVNVAWTDGHVEPMTPEAIGEEHVTEIYICKEGATTSTAFKKN